MNKNRSDVSGKAASVVAKLLIEVAVIELSDGNASDAGTSYALKKRKNESCVKVDTEADWIY